MALALYSPEDVTILLGGIYQIEGLVEGSFISIAEDNGRWTTSVTADKKVIRTYTGSGTYTISITLMSTANANGVFSAWITADSKLFGAVLPLFIKDGNGSTMMYASSTWIESAPNVDYSENVGDRTWVLKAAGVVMSVGGNEDGGLIEANLASLGLLAADIKGILQ